MKKSLHPGRLKSQPLPGKNLTKESMLFSKLAFLFLITLMACSFKVSAKGPTLARIDAEWVLDTTVSGVQCYHMLTKCGDLDVVYLKFVNTNSTSKQISWNESMTTNRPTVQGNPAGRQTITLSPGTTKADDCKTGNASLIVLGYEVDDGNGARIFSFHFVNCQVQ